VMAWLQHRPQLVRATKLPPKQVIRAAYRPMIYAFAADV